MVQLLKLRKMLKYRYFRSNSYTFIAYRSVNHILKVETRNIYGLEYGSDCTLNSTDLTTVNILFIAMRSNIELIFSVNKEDLLNDWGFGLRKGAKGIIRKLKNAIREVRNLRQRIRMIIDQKIVAN